MKIVIDDAGVALRESGNFRDFSVEIRSSEGTARRLLEAGNAGRLLDEQQAAIRIDFVVRAAGAQARDAQWQLGLRKMIDYARVKSWLAAGGTEILAHVVWPGTGAQA